MFEELQATVSICVAVESHLFHVNCSLILVCAYGYLHAVSTSPATGRRGWLTIAKRIEKLRRRDEIDAPHRRDSRGQEDPKIAHEDSKHIQERAVTH
mmetsp:Transcript_39291/g.75430  ORF Transcript_39291/g.75430 Transcript_39291/m.75430 type:complete len:97 (+) Transcript_39291:79-369(+)